MCDKISNMEERKMRKKILAVLLTALVCLCLAFTACDSDEKNEDEEKIETAKSSEGLEFGLSVDETSYVVVGIGECTDTDIVIPSEYNGKPVTKILFDAFRDCPSITSIEIPGSVTSIGDSAFSNCESLTSVTISNGVTSIGGYVFRNCRSLTSIEIPDSITSIGDGVFENCTSLVYNEYDNGCYLGNDKNPYLVLVKANDSSITNCKIHENTRMIHIYAFYGCGSLTNVEMPVGVTSIGKNAFDNCKMLASVTMPDSVTSIGENAFRGCKKLTIYCEAESQPSGWDRDWNVDSCPVVWGHTHSFVDGECVCGVKE